MTARPYPFIIGAEGSSPLEGGAPTQDPAEAPAEEPDVLVHREMSHGSVMTSRGRLAARATRAARRARRDARRADVRAGGARRSWSRSPCRRSRGASLSSRLSAIANDLHASVQIARSEAIKSNTTVTLCTSHEWLDLRRLGRLGAGVDRARRERQRDRQPPRPAGRIQGRRGQRDGRTALPADRRGRVGGFLHGLP